MICLPDVCTCLHHPALVILRTDWPLLAQLSVGTMFMCWQCRHGHRLSAKLVEELLPVDIAVDLWTCVCVGGYVFVHPGVFA